MYIKRIQVEEGFLEGLDITFEKGLNTIIGARGTGKTSVIELIRYCLNAKSFSAESSRKSHDHAVSILRGGQVTVTLQGESGEIIVTRSGDDEASRSSSAFEQPLIMSQTEVESVGLHPQGRLRLIDSFLENTSQISNQESEFVGEIKSTTSLIESGRKEVYELDASLSQLKLIDESLLALQEREKAVANYSEAAALKKQELDILSSQSAALSVAVDYLDRQNKTILEGMHSVHKGLTAILAREKWQSELPNPLESLEVRISSSYGKMAEGYEGLRLVLLEIEQLKQLRSSEKVALEDKSRELRREIDAIMEGAGSVAREGAKLRETKEKLLSLQKVREMANERVKSLQQNRNKNLDLLDTLRSKKYELRKAVCDQINEKLYPRIKVEIERASQVEEYSRLLAETLKGSGLRYNEIARSLAQLMSPRELMDAVESDNYEYISEITDIAKDRAAKAILHLREIGMGEISTCLVEDDISFFLLDGTEFKDLSMLSTGQRCTVVLPIVLEHHDRVLLVDQPEDHIDNAFIADTLIKSIRGRGDSAQLIFTTHNANIPVLGNADRVIHMSSDGKHGYVLLAEPLQHQKSINSISNVMEGGAAAFQYRAEFYSDGNSNAD